MATRKKKYHLAIKPEVYRKIKINAAKEGIYPGEYIEKLINMHIDFAPDVEGPEGEAR